jgi:hypothetical protein
MGQGVFGSLSGYQDVPLFGPVSLYTNSRRALLPLSSGIRPCSKCRVGSGRQTSAEADFLREQSDGRNRTKVSTPGKGSIGVALGNQKTPALLRSKHGHCVDRSPPQNVVVEI